MQAPSKPATPFGQMLGYILEKQPELFKSAIEDQFLRLKDEKDARERQQQEQSSSEATEATESKSTGLVLTGLSDRIQEVKDAENRATVEDLMYMCILEEFMKLGVTMLPPAENYTDVPTVNLQPLMEDVHTNQAMDLVRYSFLLGAGVVLSQFCRRRWQLIVKNACWFVFVALYDGCQDHDCICSCELHT